MATSEITDSVVKRFDEIEKIIFNLYDDARAMIDEDKGTKVVLPLLREINRLYAKLQFLAMDAFDESMKAVLNEKLKYHHVSKSKFDEVANDYLKRKGVDMDISSVITAPRTLCSSRAGLSRHSSASDLFQAKSVARKEVARLRVSQLQDLQRLEREEEELDRKKAELRRQRTLLEATQELREASLENEVIEEELHRGGFISGEGDRDVKKEDVSMSGEKVLPQTAGITSSPNSFSKPLFPEPKSCSTANRDHEATPPFKYRPCNEVRFPNDVLQDAGKSNHDVLNTLVSAFRSSLDSPKLELLKFKGDPTKYHRFMTTFATTIENTVSADRRLLYLLQYCEGKAKGLIEHCALLDPDTGYEKAKKILFENFGRRNVIARSYITNLVKGPVIKPEDSNGLIKLAQDLEECNATLQYIKYYSDVNNFDNIAKIVGRLSFRLQARWLRFAASVEKQDREPTFEDLVTFVREEAEIARSSYSSVLFKSTKKPSFKVASHSTKVTDDKGKTFFKPAHSSQSKSTQKADVKCEFCSSNHSIWSCSKFKLINLDDKWKFVREQRLCFNCLRKGHVGRDCMSQNRCKAAGCGRKHNFLLHGDRHEENKSSKQSSSSSSEQRPAKSPSAEGVGDQQCFASLPSKNNKAFLNVVPVRICAGVKEVKCFAFLDQGSTTSLCDRRLLDELDVTGEQTSFSLSTLTSSVPQVGQKVDLQVSSVDDDGTPHLKNVLSVDKLPVGTNPVLGNRERRRWPHLQDLQFSSLGHEKVMLLIGVDAPEAFWVQDKRRGKPGEPYAVKTILGWSLLGPTSGKFSGMERVEAHFLSADERLEEQVRCMWKLEECLSTNLDCQMSRYDRYALQVMDRSTTLTEDGHYQIALPWRPGAPQLNSNKSQAMIRLAYLKKRLEKDSELQKRYVSVVEDYISKGFARRIDETEDHSLGRWYLPHHPVFHPHKPKKVRVVFDCGARYAGKSLNNQLLTGPDLMNNLLGVLTRFRKENVAIVADVEAMFHQVRVDPKDHTYLRFLWWPGGEVSEPPVEYCMLVHLFGAASSPSCANFCLKQAAIDQADDFDKETVETVKRNFYMDDCLKSMASEEEATSLVSQLGILLQNRGFRLTKWLSNRKEVLSNIKEEDVSEAAWNLDEMTEPCQRVLGVRWDYITDNFEFKVQLKEKPPARRGILSVIASLFDPLGLVAPVTLPAKMLLQELCRRGLGWDEVIKEEDAASWIKWLQDLNLLSSLKVQRCFIPPGCKFEDLTVELHTFCDASSKAYATVSYLKFFDITGQIHCSFVMGKSRLAPIKMVSIPRLELMGAVLAVKMARLIKHELDGKNWRTYFWTDSTSVLYVINNSNKRFPVFVANRLAKIDEGSNPNEWKYVDTKSNPADDATRGLSSAKLTAESRWFSGPQFLLEDERCWPAAPCEFPGLPDEFAILQKPVTCMNVDTKQSTLDLLFCRYSSWTRLQKAVAWILRLKSKLLRKSIPAGPLTVDELEEAEHAIFSAVQHSEFKSEISSLPELRKSDPLRKLRPILFQGLLRVGGRLRNADEDFGVKHPIILPSSHHVTRLLIENHHRAMGHSGMTITWTSLRQKYWVIKGAEAVRKVLGKCLFCRKRNASVGKQLMADLPEGRLSTNNPPFYITGVDYFGPFEIKQGRSLVKRYGCLFTCLSTRAVHIEVAPSLTADAFINALRRFVSRRGCPHTIHSDNGTNLVGGCRELRDAISELNNSKVHSHLRQSNIRWIFNPPQASHMGGVWERQIRSTRRIFNALLSSQTLTHDLLVTLMAEAESIINSRPLTPILLDPDAKEPLTPNHLLLMRSSTTPPGLFKNTDCYSRKRWCQVQYLADQFWLRWRREYLQTLQLRQKRQRSEPNFAVNDLVLLHDDNAPRGSWPLGRVVEVYPDAKKRVRQVLVRTSTQTLRRPISKLCRVSLED